MARVRQTTVGATADISEGHRDADIVDLADIRDGDLGLVGTKAYHLGMLLRAGFEVPKGFCITTHAFRRSLASPGNAVLIPPSLRQTILDAYRHKRIAVAAIRSSAVDEDLAEASWAGIYPTTLRVTTEQDLLDSVEKCFRSVHGRVASLYRENMANGGSGNGSMAVLVQETVDAQAAGVLFTVNPLTRSEHELCINAVPGLAEPLMSGRVTGDAFTVTPDGEIVEQRISAKSRMLTRAGEAPVARRDRRSPALGSRHIRKLARMGRDIENCFGCPQDVEFAVANGRIYVVQARPIPAGAARRDGLAERVDAYVRREHERLRERIAALRGNGVLRAEDAVFSNGNIGELLPTPTPMSFGIFRHIFASERGAIVSGRRLLGYRLTDGAAENLYELICGHAYFNLEVDAGTFSIGFPLDVPGYLERIERDPSLASYPELGLYEQQLTREDAVARFGPDGERHFRTYSTFRARLAAHGETFLRAYSAIAEPEFERYLERERTVDLSAFSAPALVERVGVLLRHLKHFSCVQFVIAARIGFFFTEAVESGARTLFGEEGGQVVNKLLQGLEGSRVTERAIDMERVARGEMDRAEFLRRHGHLAPNELEISEPRIAETPGALERMLQDFSPSTRSPAKEFRRQVHRRKVLERQVRRRLQAAGRTAEQIDGFFAELRLAQAFLPLRETIKSTYTAEYALIRSALLHLARRVGLGPEEIFYLYPDELQECLGPAGALRDRIRRRHEERRMAQILAREKRMPPLILGRDLEAIGEQPNLAVAREMEATRVAPGQAIGVARILQTEKIDLARVMKELTGDEIIVMRAANLGMAPLFRKVAGLILEIGGILAHGACQARESGIPAVVLENATVLLRDGARIRVDGNTGTVSLVDHCDGEGTAATPL
jgi:pyruvate,water dikinase